MVCVVDREAEVDQFGDQPSQRKTSILHLLQQPVPMFPSDQLRSVASHLSRLNAASFAEPRYPVDHCTDANIKVGSGLPARQTIFLNR